MEDTIKQIFQDSIETKNKVMNNLTKEIENSTNILINALKDDKKILICGNGGSAADAQHFAAELLIKFEKDRKSLPAIALTTDTSTITAGSNDLGYENIFQKQVESLGSEEDVLIGITTSGNSPNIIKALDLAKSKNMKTICLNGKDGGIISNIDSNIIIPSQNTARIQESHITIIHTWCKLIEDSLF